MGNNPSSALAVANARAGFKNAMKDVNEQLGLSDEQREKKVEVPKAIGCANKQEQKLRREEREREYKEKQMAREKRKELLKQKWSTSHRENTTAEKRSSWLGGGSSK
jgi:hypothetical protein